VNKSNGALKQYERAQSWLKFQEDN